MAQMIPFAEFICHFVATHNPLHPYTRACSIAYVIEKISKLHMAGM